MMMTAQEKHTMAGVIAAHPKVVPQAKGDNHIELSCSGRFCDWKEVTPADDDRSFSFIHAQHVTGVIDRTVFQ